MKYLGHDIEAVKKVVGHAYAKSGNAHNPTERVRWLVMFDGKHVDTLSTKKAALEAGKVHAMWLAGLSSLD